jgi:mannosyltransferase OCH1-like enzyme
MEGPLCMRPGLELADRKEGTEKVQIPQRMAHIWIGPFKAPTEWMRTWPETNPKWSYQVYDNEFCSNFKFQNQKLIDAYIGREQFAGAADLIRYELLHEYGGFIPEADSVCERPVDEIFRTGTLFTVYENEFVRGKLVSPILAAAPGHPFLKQLIDRLHEISPGELKAPWETTGNLFLARMIKEFRPDIVIFPSYYFIPEHFTGIVYDGDGPVYGRQLFGSTLSRYKYGSNLARVRAL